MRQCKVEAPVGRKQRDVLRIPDEVRWFNANAQWTPQRLVRWAEKTGPATASVVQSILERRAHPQQGFRSCLGIMRLGKSFGEERLEAACRRALTLGACSYKSIESILRQGLDRKRVPEQQELELSIEHENIRGSDYYH
jgi:transposase